MILVPIETYKGIAILLSRQAGVFVAVVEERQLDAPTLSGIRRKVDEAVINIVEPGPPVTAFSLSRDIGLVFSTNVVRYNGRNFYDENNEEVYGTKIVLYNQILHERLSAIFREHKALQTEWRDLVESVPALTADILKTEQARLRQEAAP